MARVREILLPWTSQPQEAVNPNCESSLTKGLVSLIDAASGRDLLGTVPLSRSTAITNVVGSRGVAAHNPSVGSTNGIYSERGEYGATKVVRDLTLMVLSPYSGVITGGSRNIVGVGDGQNGGYSIKRDYEYALARIKTTAGSYTLSGFPSKPWTSAHELKTLTYDGETLSLYGGGALLLSTSATGDIVYDNIYGHFQIFGNPRDGVPSESCDVYFVGVWDRALTAEEVEEAASNPWQLFTPQSIWVPVSAGGGGGTVTADGESSYSILGSLQSDAAAAYGVMGAVASDAAAAYGLAGTVQQDAVASYSIVGKVQSDGVAGYSIAGVVPSDGIAAYGIANAVQSDGVATYSILSASTVSSDASAAYSIAGSVAADGIAAYSLQGAVAANVSAAYSVQGSIAADGTGSYAITGSALVDGAAAYAVMGSVQSDAMAAWEIENVGAVQADAVAAYVVVGAVASSASASYGILGDAQEMYYGSGRRKVEHHDTGFFDPLEADEEEDFEVMEIISVLVAVGAMA